MDLGPQSLMKSRISDQIILTENEEGELSMF